MQLEEKALSWLVDSWRLENGQMAKSKMASHSLVDMLALLEGICGFSRRSNLVCKIMLPACPIVDSAMEQANAKVIRDFLLDAYLPPYGAPVGSDEPDPVLSLKSSAGSWISSLNEPTPRERRVSSFMLKYLDLLLADREMPQGGNNHPTAEQARRWVDAAALALAYESVLVLNGTRSNRRVVHAAGKLIITITPLLISSKWTVEEQALVLLGLDPLTAISLDNDEDQGWETMLPPDIGTGIKSDTLKLLTSKRETKWVHSRALRRELQRIIWHHNDVSSFFYSQIVR
jgi:ataxia telangiectasia mutated family protein